MGDARAKLTILALAGLHSRVAAETVPARTIDTMHAVDLDYAAQLGCTIRQISRADLKATRCLPKSGRAWCRRILHLGACREI